MPRKKVWTASETLLHCCISLHNQRIIFARPILIGTAPECSLSRRWMWQKPQIQQRCLTGSSRNHDWLFTLTEGVRDSTIDEDDAANVSSMCLIGACVSPCFVSMSSSARLFPLVSNNYAGFGSLPESLMKRCMVMEEPKFKNVECCVFFSGSKMLPFFKNIVLVISLFTQVYLILKNRTS